MPRPLTLDNAFPTWSQVESSPKYQALDDAGKESVRESFWRDVVSPRVPTEELEQALGHFEQRSGGRLKAVRLGPPPSSAELERASGPLRMVMTKQGQPMVGHIAERSIHTLRGMQRREPMLKGYSDVQVAAVVAGGLTERGREQAGSQGSAAEAPASLP